MRQVRLKIEGKVQGVFFRKHTKEKADELHINGFVRNERDGSVYVEAEGNDDDIEDFIDWCYEGPEKADVTNVEVSEGKVNGFEGFEVRYD